MMINQNARFRKALGVIFASLVVMLASGCAKSASTIYRINIPPMDSYAASPCFKPGVDANPKVAVVEHRRALADCEERRTLAVDAYNNVREKFGLKPETQE